MTRSESFRPEELVMHGDSLRRLAQRLVRDGGLAEDLVQEAYAAALASPPHSPGALAAWLARVVRTRAAELRRGADRRARRERMAARVETAPETVAERLAVHGELLFAVRDLREPYRTAIVLRYYESLSPREIAQSLGVPVKTVKTRLARALEELRRTLDARHDGERRAWALLLLPLARDARSGPLLASIIHPGILIMSSKAALTAIAVTLALAVAFVGIWTFRERRPSAASPEGSRPTEALASARGNQEPAEPDVVTAPPRRESVDVADRLSGSGLSSVREEGSRVLNGRVLSESGVPVPGIVVSARSVTEPRAWVDGKVSGSDGRFRMDGIPPGTLIDVVLMRANCTLERVLDVKPVEEEMEFRVAVDAPEARIRGVVLSPDGDPTIEVDVSAARKQDIYFMSFGNEPSQPEEPDLELGGFLLAGLREGVYTLTVRPKSAEWAVYRSEPRRLTAGETWDLGIIQLQAGGRFVTRSHASVPELDATVDVYDSLDRRVAGMKAGSKSRPLQSGQYWLEVHGERAAAQRFLALIHDGQDTVVDIYLRPGIPHAIECRFDSHVIKRGDWIQCQIEQAGAVILQKTLTVEREGRAEFEVCLLPGAYTVHARIYLTFSPAGDNLAASADFTVAESEADVPSEVYLR